jgi:hypothetical protein
VLVGVGVGVCVGGMGVLVGALLGGTEVAVGDIDVDVKVGGGVSVGASAVWVAKVLAAIFVAWASTSAWDGPQATKMAPVNRHTKTKGTFFSTCRTSFSKRGRRISVNVLAVCEVRRPTSPAETELQGHHPLRPALPQKPERPPNLGGSNGRSRKPPVMHSHPLLAVGRCGSGRSIVCYLLLTIHRLVKSTPGRDRPRGSLETTASGW